MLFMRKIFADVGTNKMIKYLWLASPFLLSFIYPEKVSIQHVVVYVNTNAF